jgi:hypothetical protein
MIVIEIPMGVLAASFFLTGEKKKKKEKEKEKEKNPSTPGSDSNPQCKSACHSKSSQPPVNLKLLPLFYSTKKI